jgi:MFS family permease
MANGTAKVTRTDAESLDIKSPRDEWERGWKIVAVALVAYVFGSAGMFYAFGLFFKPLRSEFHWSREAISGFFSISGVIFAVASPIVGRLADRFGVRRVILVCIVLVAVIYGSQSLLTRHLWHYYALAFLWGAATAGTTALTFGKVISNWFDRSRGLALSILGCASGWEPPSYLRSRSHSLPIMGGAKHIFCLACLSLLWGQFRWRSYWKTLLR